MKRRVQMVSRSCFLPLSQLYRISHSVHAFMTGRLDYCNGLLAGAPRVVTDVYQNVQNASARPLTGHP